MISHCVLNCICLVPSDGKHLLICLFVVCTSVFGKVSSFFAQF